MIKKSALLFSSLLLLSGLVFAQKTSTVKVSLNFPKADTSSSVTLQLYILPDTVLVGSKAVNNGAASFTVKSFSKFLLKLSSVTFENTEKIISVTDKPVSTSFYLKLKNTTLGDVVVVSKKP